MVDVQSVELTLLNTDEIVELDRLETTIQHGLETFMEVGSALAEINDKKLWRQTHASFVDYARERWGMGKTYAYNLVAGAEVAGRISSIEEISQPENESQVRPLRQLAPERQPEAWRRAVETAPNGEITAEHVKSVVDEMLGRRGRFEGKMYYAIWGEKRLIFNEPKAKSGDFYNDSRFSRMEFTQGRDLNQEKKYDAYSLVAVPEVNPQELALALPNFQTHLQYPVHQANRVIYDAGFQQYGSPGLPEKTYADCEWMSGYEIKGRWGSIKMPLGEYAIAPARPIPTEWVAESHFKPGMSARCPECAKSAWNKEKALQPYETWTAVEPKVWACPTQHHHIDDAKLTFETYLPGLDQPQSPAAPAAPTAPLPEVPAQGSAPEEPDQPDDDEDDDEEPDDFDLEEILDLVVSLDDLLIKISEMPGVVEMALAEDLVKEYRMKPYNGIQPSDEAINIVRKWLESQ